MLRPFKHIFLIIFLSIVTFNVFSQIKSVGIPSIENFTRQDYHASTQNWATVQDKRGVMYFGNNDGLLEFDGVGWRLIQMPNTSVVRSLAVDESGNIYVGAFNEFGMLKATSNGSLEYKSLLELVPKEIKNFGDIWKIHEMRNGIIFQSFTEIFLYKNGKVEVIAQNRDFHFSFLVNEELYITERNKGLLRLKDEKLIPVKGGERFNNDIWAMVPFDETKILIGTANNGLFILENGAVSSWNTPVNDFLRQNQIYCATQVKGHFAIGTILNGLLVINKEGIAVQTAKKEEINGIIPGKGRDATQR